MSRVVKLYFSGESLVSCACAVWLVRVILKGSILIFFALLERKELKPRFTDEDHATIMIILGYDFIENDKPSVASVVTTVQLEAVFGTGTLAKNQSFIKVSE